MLTGTLFEAENAAVIVSFTYVVWLINIDEVGHSRRGAGAFTTACNGGEQLRSMVFQLLYRCAHYLIDDLVGAVEAVQQGILPGPFC